MKLYYSKGACSLAVHIALEELGLAYEPVPVDLRKPNPEYLAINPMGAVPVLELDDGQRLTEAAVILQYLADRKPETGLAPRAGTMERYRLAEWLNFIATEIHKGFGPLWGLESMSTDPKAREEIRAYATAELGYRLDIIVRKMGTQPYLMPSGYSVADAYLFTVLNWTSFLKVDLSRWPQLTTYLERVKARPAVTSAMRAERLVA